MRKMHALVRREGDTLADIVVRNQEKVAGLRYTAAARDACRVLTRTQHRYVLDDEASSFLADLGSAPFTSKKPELYVAMIDSLRRTARLPHPRLWMEFSGRRFCDQLVVHKNALRTARGDRVDIGEGVPHIGLLMDELPGVAGAYRMREFSATTDMVGSMPFTFVWTTTEDPLPDTLDIRSGMFGHGAVPWLSPHFAVEHDEIPIPGRYAVKIGRDYSASEANWETHVMCIDSSGILRYALAFLATLSEAPLRHAVVNPRGGYVVGGRVYSRPTYTSLSLTLRPGVSALKVAKRLVVGAHRRAHDVRGHWRVYPRGDGAPCEPRTHVWGADDHCAACGGWRTWVDPYRTTGEKNRKPKNIRVRL